MMVDDNKITINKDDISGVIGFIKNHPIIIIGTGVSIAMLGVCVLIDNNIKGAN